MGGHWERGGSFTFLSSREKGSTPRTRLAIRRAHCHGRGRTDPAQGLSRSYPGVCTDSRSILQCSLVHLGRRRIARRAGANDSRDGTRGERASSWELSERAASILV